MKFETEDFLKIPYLDERLESYSRLDYYPFHMPGHKRSEIGFFNPYKIDITEIEGFDNLHHAEDILWQSQERLRKLYGSRQAYYLVNGSTCGILSAIGSIVKFGDKAIIARNSHKAVYNATKLFHLKVGYIYPKILEEGVQGVVDPKDVEKALREQENVKIVVITSPTYDGMISDVRKIADIVHKHHAKLVVDEAHGAHFSLAPETPVSAIHLGADLVVQSLHKTLPCFTQTAVLHIVDETIDCRRVEKMLEIFQTSSPSYILMAGIERCVHLLETEREQRFQRFYQMLDVFYEKTRNLRHLKIWMPEDGSFFDRTKIIISTRRASLDGRQLYDMLLKEYHIQLEMYSAEYALAMTSIMDRQEGFDRLCQALCEIDRSVVQKEKSFFGTGDSDFMEKAYGKRKKIMEIGDVDFFESRKIIKKSLKHCLEKTSAENIYLYPPGIPMVVQGELIDESLIDALVICSKKKLNVIGAAEMEPCSLFVLA